MRYSIRIMASRLVLGHKATGYSGLFNKSFHYYIIAFKWVFKFYFQVLSGTPLSQRLVNVKSDSGYFVDWSHFLSLSLPEYTHYLIISPVVHLALYKILIPQPFPRLALVQKMHVRELIFLSLMRKWNSQSTKVKL